MDKRKILTSMSLVSVVFMILLTIVYPYAYASRVKNVLFYGGVCLILVAVYYITGNYLNEINVSSIFPLSAIGMGIGFFIWGIFTYIKEPEDPYFIAAYSVRHQIPSIIFLSLGIVLSVLLFIVIQRNNVTNKIVRAVVSAVILGTQGIMLYAPCIINDQGGSLYHIHAYFNPIYNTGRLLPFDDIIKSIYGHYSVFYLIPVKLMSLIGLSEVRAVIIIQCIIGMVSFGLVYYTISKLVKNDCLFYLSVIAISGISFSTYSSGQYYQLLPHRVLFPALTLFFAYKFCWGRVKKYWGLIISTASLIWNFETGLVCTLVIACIFVACYLKDKEKTKIYTAALYFIGFVCLSFTLAILLLGGTNVILGGKMMSIKDFIFPLLSDEFRVDELELRLPGVFSLFYFEVIVFVGTSCAFLPRVFNKSASLDDMMILVCSALGLGLIPYYTNRAATNNISITHVAFIVLLTLLLNRILTQKEKAVSFFIRMICVCLLSFFAFDAIISIPFAVKMRANSTWNISLYHEFLNEFQQEIPKNTIAIGPGLPDIYSDLGWDPGIYVMDWVDCENSEAVYSYVGMQIESANNIIVSKDFVEQFVDGSKWLKIKEIGGAYYYCDQFDNGVENVIEAAVDYADLNQLSDIEFVELIELNTYGYLLDEEKTLMLSELLRDSENRSELGYLIYQNAMECDYE